MIVAALRQHAATRAVGGPPHSVPLNGSSECATMFRRPIPIDRASPTVQPCSSFERHASSSFALAGPPNHALVATARAEHTRSGDRRASV